MLCLLLLTLFLPPCFSFPSPRFPRNHNFACILRQVVLFVLCCSALVCPPVCWILAAIRFLVYLNWSLFFVVKDHIWVCIHIPSEKTCNFILFINVWWPVWITRWWLKFMDQILWLTGFFLCYVCMFSLCLYGLSLDTLASFDSTNISVSKLAITVKVRVNNRLPLCVSRVTD